MSQRFAIEIKRLCLCMVYMAAARVCATLKRRYCASGGAGAILTCQAVRMDSNDANCYSSVMKGADSKTASCARNFFGRIFSSLPYPVQRVQCASGRDFYVYVVREDLTGFGARRAAPRPAVPRFKKDAERPRGTGLEMLRVTFNLARGNIEDQAPRLSRFGGQYVYCARRWGVAA